MTKEPVTDSDSVQDQMFNPAQRWLTTPQWEAYRDQADQRALTVVFMPAELRHQGASLSGPLPANLAESYRELAAKVRMAYRRASGLLPNATTKLGKGQRNEALWFRIEAPRARLTDLKPTPEMLPAIGKALATSLGRLHERGVLHLDLHPETIGVDSGEVAPVGFGVDVRRELSRISTDNQRLARHGFSPPELWDGSGNSELGPWTDVYAASATLFTCLMGEPPPDFRQRMRSPGSHARLVAAMEARLASAGLSGPGLVSAIANGLSPRRSNRPQTILDWASGMEVSAAAAEAPSPPKERMEQRARTRPLAPFFSLVFAVLVTGGAALAFVMKDQIGEWLSPPPPEKVIAIPEAPKRRPEPAKPKPKPAPTWPSGQLAGVAFEDDPALLKDALEEQGLTLPAAARLLSRPFRDASDKLCATPLRLHLRKDGQGLLVQRPAGLTWVTEWSRGKKPPTVGLSFTIQSVVGEEGPIDAPGLVGASRRLILEADEMTIVYALGNSTERETYLACSGSE